MGKLEESVERGSNFFAQKGCGDCQADDGLMEATLKNTGETFSRKCAPNSASTHPASSIVGRVRCRHRIVPMYNGSTRDDDEVAKVVGSIRNTPGERVTIWVERLWDTSAKLRPSGVLS